MTTAEVVRLATGYIVKASDKHGTAWYLTKNYKGKYMYMLDYAYAKKFRDKKTAQKHAKKIMEG